MVAVPRRKTVSTKKAGKNTVVVKDVSKRTTKKDKIVIKNKVGNISAEISAPKVLQKKAAAPIDSSTPPEISIRKGSARISIKAISTYKLPLPDQKYLSQTARIAGVFITTVGALLSLANIQFANGLDVSVVQTAQTISTTSVKVENSTTEKTPAVRLSLPTTEPLKGLVPVTIIVSSASEVKLLAENKNTKGISVVASASKVDDTTWKANWTTTSFPDGEYRLRFPSIPTFGRRMF
jgi:hypothetical protein